jgi:uncharacterized protein (TIGR00661 family)
MARILYGICGEGGGHASRSYEVISHLKKNGHEVVAITYGTALWLKKYVNVFKFPGLNISFSNNQADYAKTILDNLGSLPERIEHFGKLMEFVKKFKPQIAITDFEPATSTIAGLLGIPLISIDNQHRITNAQIESPSKYNSQKIVADAVIRAMVGNTKACLVISFHPAKLTSPKTFIFPPILRSEIIKLKPKKKNYILVYQTTSTNKELIKILKQINEKFVVYGFDVAKKDKNLVFKKRNEKGFIKDLKDCKAVITNGGFTLITESLYLGKPVLSVPILGQFEQILNAFYLEKLGYGKFCEKLTSKQTLNFIKNLKKYETNLEHYKKEDNHRIFNMLDELIEQYAIR